MNKLRWTSLMSEVAEPFCRTLTTYLNQQLIQRQLAEIQFVEDLGYAQHRQMVMDGLVDMAWICGVDYVGNTERLDWPYSPFVAPCIGDGLKPVYYSDMIVQADSAYRSFEDLRGATWAYNEEGSWSGYKVVQAHLAQIGESGPYFADKIVSGSHRNSIKMVREGKADTAAIDSTVIEMGQVTESALMTDLRIVERIGPYPMPPFVLSRKCPSDLRQALESIFLNMHESSDGLELLSHWQVQRFAPVLDRDYDRIRNSLNQSAQIIL